MTISSLVLYSTYARRMPDPVFKGIDHYFFWVPAHTLVEGVSYGPNARNPNTRKHVYKTVNNSLLNIDCIENSFHLKNLGIFINAKGVKKINEEEYLIDLSDYEHTGVLNGGHTLDLIVKRINDGSIPPTQFVKVEVRTGIPNDWLSEIAGGLNTALQVEDMSLDDLAGAFDWIKDALRNEHYFKVIAWSENDPGEYDARDLVSLLTCFHIGLYPNDGSSHPVEAYEKKSKALDNFRKDFELNDSEEFRRLRPIMKDIFVLHDTIQYEFAMYHNKNGGKAGKLNIMDVKDENSKTLFNYVFIGKQDRMQLQTGALYPLLAAFRWMVEEKPSGEYGWRGGFKAVLKRWKDTAPELVRKTYDRSRELSGNANAIGKSRTHWETLHQTVAFRDLIAQAAGNARAPSVIQPRPKSRSK
ncbi:AIPR family protein [Microvirga rosea]|uniref:AIPR family protein n=1 Tax=Microvirga rosea TaxID=2715425 RepID=UPI001D0A228F|nr:AIPR family protein [Microvirga rosea]MCB8820614.1 AIPR family protein [Microvirga rosea]